MVWGDKQARWKPGIGWTPSPYLLTSVLLLLSAIGTHACCCWRGQMFITCCEAVHEGRQRNLTRMVM